MATWLRQIGANSGEDDNAILRVFLALLAEDDAAKGCDPDLLSAMRGSILGSRAHRRLRSILKKDIFL